jgi:hypothetical protein
MRTIGQQLLIDAVRRTSNLAIARRVGLSAPGVSNHAAGRRIPGPRARDAYARVLGIDVDAWSRLA